MAATLTIYEVVCTDAYMMSEQDTGYSISPWGRDTGYYRGYDDGGVEYLTPEGFSIGEEGREPTLYDGTGYRADIVSLDGRPAYLTRGDSMPNATPFRRA